LGYNPRSAEGTGEADVELTSSRRTEDILRGQNLVLQELARGRNLGTVLDTLARSAEEVMPGMRCSILLLKGRRLMHCAAPSMPREYVEAVDGLEIGPNVGSCGTAAYFGKRVVVEDVLLHPSWVPFREAAKGAGFRACWSEPFFSTTGETLGTFAMYYDEPRQPSELEIDFIRTTAHLAGIATEHKRAEQALRDSEGLFRELTENIHEVFWITDWLGRKVLYVSPAYEAIWGRSCQSLYDHARSWAEVIHPEDRERVVRSFEDDAARGAYETEYRILCDDGSERWIHDRAFPIRDEQGAVYRLAGFSADITERKQIERDLLEAKDELDVRRRAQLRSLTSELLLAEERERQAVARDLHDGLGQTISLAQMKLAQLRKAPVDEWPADLEAIERLIDEANRASRSLTFQLSPPILHDLGFGPAVQWLVEDIESTYGLDIALEEAEPPPDLDEKVRVLLFRALRELLVNVAKHAKAKEVFVRVRPEGERVRISVEDDGTAFDTAAVGKRGVGLYSIRERLGYLGGHMSIESEAGRGTRVTLVAPLTVESGSGEAP